MNNLSMTLVASGIAIMALGMLAIQFPLVFIGLGVAAIGYVGDRDRV
jgi:uncharacterized membrane protein